ncbi:hypothetical protein EPN54_04060, partial [bacterium]
MARRIISLIICLSFLFQQTGLVQAAAVELNLSNYFARMSSGLAPIDSFRPLHLRYFSYDSLNNSFKVLLDKGDLNKGLSPKGTVPKEAEAQLKEETKELLKYFLIGLTLPNDKFWVNLRPDSPSQIIDFNLEETDIGKIMLEADLQLKKDTASFTSPQTAEGKEYWNRLYKKASELYGNENITIPTLTRPWIVPNEIIVRETKDSAYIYKATLKVMLEQDYLKDSTTYSFKDSRAKALNEYSSQLIRELIIPKLTKEVNLSKKYAPLRQVYYSLILSRWFKSRFYGQSGTYPSLIDKNDLTNLTSKTTWDKNTYFNEYKRSFAQGEYNIQEPVYTPTGQTIRSYFSGGIGLTQENMNMSNKTAVASPIGLFYGNAAVAMSPAIGKLPNMALLAVPADLKSIQYADRYEDLTAESPRSNLGTFSSAASAEGQKAQETASSAIENLLNTFKDFYVINGIKAMADYALIHAAQAEGGGNKALLDLQVLRKYLEIAIETNLLGLDPASLSFARGHDEILAALLTPPMLRLLKRNGQLCPDIVIDYFHGLDFENLVKEGQESVIEANIPGEISGLNEEYIESYIKNRCFRIVVEELGNIILELPADEFGALYSEFKEQMKSAAFTNHNIQYVKQRVVEIMRRIQYLSGLEEKDRDGYVDKLSNDLYFLQQIESYTLASSPLKRGSGSAADKKVTEIKTELLSGLKRLGLSIELIRQYIKTSGRIRLGAIDNSGDYSSSIY